MTLKSNYLIVLFLLFLSFSNCSSTAQTVTAIQKEELAKTILKLDTEFWEAYNSCNLETFKTFLTDDLEFYHDKGGLTKSSSKLMKQVAEGLCGNKNSVLRREAVEGSVNVYPLNNYGAIITGEHLFYLKENNAKERLVEKAKFTHVWKLDKKQWRMSRVLSYDHQPASENSTKAGMKLSSEILRSYVGTYKAPKTGLVKISISKEGTLFMDAGRMKAQLYSEKENKFFIKEAPITLEFVKNEKGQVTKFIVSENGNPVEEAIKER